GPCHCRTLVRTYTPGLRSVCRVIAIVLGRAGGCTRRRAGVERSRTLSAAKRPPAMIRPTGPRAEVAGEGGLLFDEPAPGSGGKRAGPRRLAPPEHRRGDRGAGARGAADPGLDFPPRG